MLVLMLLLQLLLLKFLVSLPIVGSVAWNSLGPASVFSSASYIHIFGKRSMKLSCIREKYFEILMSCREILGNGISLMVTMDVHAKNLPLASLIS